MHRSFSYKLLMQFPRYSGNRNQALRFSQDKYTGLENVFQQTRITRELLKYDLNSTEYDTFQEIIVSLLNVYATLKKKYLRANHASFVTKELRKAII